MAVPLKVGIELRDRRIEMGMRQQDLADRIGMSRGYISMVEGGVPWMPSADVLRKWSLALNWPPDALARKVVEAGDDQPYASDDIVRFVRDQARIAVNDELVAALRHTNGALAKMVRATIDEALIEAIAAGIERVRDRERKAISEEVSHYLTADAVIARAEAHDADFVINGKPVEAKTHAGPRLRPRTTGQGGQGGQVPEPPR